MKISPAHLIFVLSGLFASIFSSSCQSKHQINGDAAYDHTVAILACGPRPPESDGLAKSQDYISQQLSQHGWKTITQSVVRDTPVGKRTFTNLIARYQPDQLNTLEELFQLPTKGILGAHLDSKLIPDIPDFLGADDAASACALIIEIAANLSKNHPTLAKELELVFFDGEEAFNKNMSLETGDGLYGSRAYAIDLYKRKPKPQFGIILDMVGHKNLMIEAPADSPPALYQAMQDAAKLHGHSKHFGMAKGGILDDHYYLNKAGVPTIDIIGADFAHSHWWHQPGDDIDLISAKSLQISYDVTMTMLEELLK